MVWRLWLWPYPHICFCYSGRCSGVCSVSVLGTMIPQLHCGHCHPALDLQDSRVHRSSQRILPETDPQACEVEGWRKGYATLWPSFPNTERVGGRTDGSPPGKASLRYSACASACPRPENVSWAHSLTTGHRVTSVIRLGFCLLFMFMVAF